MTARGQQSKQGQSVREKFFQDFVQATSKFPSPERVESKCQKVDWLPELLFVESIESMEAEKADSATAEGLFSSEALFR